MGNGSAQRRSVDFQLPPPTSPPQRDLLTGQDDSAHQQDKDLPEEIFVMPETITMKKKFE